jgi:hypothetical protein
MLFCRIEVVFFLNVMAMRNDGFVKNLKHVAGFRQQKFLSKTMVVSDVTPVYSHDLRHYTVYGTSGNNFR